MATKIESYRSNGNLRKDEEGSLTSDLAESFYSNPISTRSSTYCIQRSYNANKHDATCSKIGHMVKIGAVDYFCDGIAVLVCTPF